MSSSALRRALIIPTDRPIEACLAGLPVPLEGLRDDPFPAPLPPLVPLSRHPGVSRGKVSGIAVGTALGLSNVRTRKEPPVSPPGRPGRGGGVRRNSQATGGRQRFGEDDR